MTTDDFARQTQFDYLYNGIKERLPGLFSDDKQTIFQFMEMPIEANWTVGNHSIAVDLADSVPAKLGGFYARGAGRVTLAYESLLMSMYQAIGDKNGEYRKLKDLVITEYQRLNVAINKAKVAYQAWRQQNLDAKLSLSEWLENDIEAEAFKDEIEELRKSIKKKNSQCERIEGALGQALTIAQDKLRSDTVLLENGKVVPRTVIGGSLQDDIARWKSAKDRGEFDLNVTINKDQHIATPWHTTVKADTHAASCHAPELNSYVNMKRVLLDQHYSLNVKAVGLQGYSITRGDWYNDTFVKSDQKLPEGASLKTEDFFGKDGSLHLIPTAILVMYHPVIELTISTKTFVEEIENNTRLKAYPGPLMLFGLNFDVSASLKMGVKEKDETTTMTIIPPENQPAQILGVTSVNKSMA